MTTTKTKERGILFSAPMVRALLEGRKVQTRRVINPQPTLSGTSGFAWKGNAYGVGSSSYETAQNFAVANPFGHPGDRLWVREAAWYDRKPIKDLAGRPMTPGLRCFYVDGKVKMEKTGDYGWSVGGEVQAKAGHLEDLYRLNSTLAKRPSLLMPRWASRITLEITKVRVERVREISADDVLAEGLPIHVHPLTWKKSRRSAWREDLVVLFGELWDSLHGESDNDWSSNPWVWVIEFRRVT